MSENVPAGYYKLDAQEVWSNDKYIVILGAPDYDEDDPEAHPHNCDDMGCGSFGPHVLRRGLVIA